MTRLRRVLLGAAGVAVLGIATLAVEVVVAGRGPKVDEPDPASLNAVIGPAGDARAPLRVLWLGDSTAAGVGSTNADGSMPRQVATRLGRPVDVRVLAVSGAQVGEVASLQIPRVDELIATGWTPELVLVSVGANDVTHLAGTAGFGEQYRLVLDRLPVEANVVMLGVPDMGSPPRLAQPLRWVAGQRGGAIDAVVREVADERGHAYVDIAGETGPAFRDAPSRYFALDEYHPNDAGYALWADAVADITCTRVSCGPGG